MPADLENKIKQGEALFKESKLSEAESFFTKLLIDYPSNLHVLNNLGVISHALGKTSEAETYIEKVLEVQKDDLGALINLSSILLSRGKFDSAKQYLEHANMIQPSNAEILSLLGQAEYGKGGYHKAVKCLQESIRLNPSQSEVQDLLKRISSENMEELFLPKPGTYRAAFTEIDITPNLDDGNIPMLQGMGGKARKASGVNLPLKLQMVLLEDDHFTKLLIVSADLFGFGGEIIQQVQQIAGMWGIAPGAVILNASHTHYAPGTVSNVNPCLGPFYLDFARQIVQLIDRNLHLLYKNLEPAALLTGCTEACIGVNRRSVKDGSVEFSPNPNGSYDTAVALLLVRLEEKKERLLLVNHGCHPTGLGASTEISADFPAIVRKEIISASVAEHIMFLQGGAGDVKEGRIEKDKGLFSQNIDGVRTCAAELSWSIIDRLREDLAPVCGSVTCVNEAAVLSMKHKLTLNKLQEMASEKTADALIRQWAKFILKKFPDGNVPNKLSIQVQLVGIGGDVVFITLPGEPVSEIAINLRKMTPNPDAAFICGYTNGLLGYLPTDRMIKEGGYEVEFSNLVYLMPAPFEPGVESAITTAAEKGLTILSDEKDSTVYGRYHSGKKEKQAFFVMSAGRCGTLTLTHLLDTAANTRVWHHPLPFLVDETLLAYRNEIDKQKTFWQARYTVINKSWSEGLIHGETDMNMTPFCDTIAEEIPESKFLVLVRNPWDFVRSGMRRGYYAGHMWDSGRLRPKEGTKEYDEWNRLDRFEKVCWLWKETYKHIFSLCDKISNDRIKIVRFEDLVDSSRTSEDIFSFLGLEGFQRQKIEGVLSEKFNAQSAGNFPKPVDWSYEMHRKLWAHCEKISEKFSYDRKFYQKKKEKGSCNSQRTRRKLLFLELPNVSTGGHLDHVVADLKKRHDVKYKKTTDIGEIKRLVEWADVVWLEWANQMADEVTNKFQELLHHKPTLCRLHGYEVFTPFPGKINWNVVDKLIFVAKHKQAIFNKRFSNPNVDQVVIRNGVDTERFSVPDNKKNTKNLLLFGHLNQRKGLPLLIQFYNELLKKDGDFHLTIRGEWQDPRYQMAVMTMVEELKLHKKITFVQEWIDDLNKWFINKSHILSFSLEESFHYTIGNGMAAGMKPVIHAWNESRDIWPEEFIFNDLDGFIRNVTDEQYTPDRYRSLLFENGLDSDRQIGAVEAVIDETVDRFQMDEKKRVQICKPVREVAVVDQALKRSSGHSMMLAEDYCNILKDDYDVKMLGAVDKGNIHSQFNVVPVISSNNDLSTCVLNNVEEIKKNTANGAVLIFQTASGSLPITLAGLLLSAERRIILIYHNSFQLIADPNVRKIILDVIQQKKNSINAKNIYVYGTSRLVAEEIKQVFPGYNVGFINNIYNYTQNKNIYDTVTFSDKLDDGLLRVAYVGVAKVSKNFHLLPNIVNVSGEEFQFNVHCSPLHTGLYEPSVEKAIERLRRMKYVNLFYDMSPEEYVEFLRTNDVCLLLYNARTYRNKLSYVYVEALAAGMPMVVTKDLWYAENILFFNAGVLVEDVSNAQEIKSALELIQNNYSYYFNNARRLFEYEFDQHNNRRFVLKALQRITRDETTVTDTVGPERNTKAFYQQPYDGKEYWDSRLRNFGSSMRGVGLINLSEEQNKQMYQEAKNVFLQLCSDLNVDFNRVRVLDIGTGQGFYARTVYEQGCRDYTGIDITDALFTQMKAELPGYTYKKMDVSENKIPGRYNVIYMIDVAQHITSYFKFIFAMQNVRRALEDGGVFIVTSHLEDSGGAAHFRNWGKDYFEKAFPEFEKTNPRPFRDKYIFGLRKPVTGK